MQVLSKGASSETKKALNLANSPIRVSAASVTNATTRTYPAAAVARHPKLSPVSPRLIGATSPPHCPQLYPSALSRSIRTVSASTHICARQTPKNGPLITSASTARSPATLITFRETACALAVPSTTPHSNRSPSTASSTSCAVDHALRRGGVVRRIVSSGTCARRMGA